MWSHLWLLYSFWVFFSFNLNKISTIPRCIFFLNSLVFEICFFISYLTCSFCVEFTVLSDVGVEIFFLNWQAFPNFTYWLVHVWRISLYTYGLWMPCSCPLVCLCVSAEFCYAVPLSPAALYATVWYQIEQICSFSIFFWAIIMHLLFQVNFRIYFDKL